MKTKKKEVKGRAVKRKSRVIKEILPGRDSKSFTLVVERADWINDPWLD